MKKPGFIARAKMALTLLRKGILAGVNDRGGWVTLIRESFAGAWQQDVVVNQDAVLAQTTVFSCQTLIASDISKMCIKLMQKNADRTWEEVNNSAFSPVLRKPNHFQTRQQFVETWILSKLSRGNTFALKQRDNRKIVTALYVLNPDLCKPLVAPNGDIYYALQEDWLSGLAVGVPAIPASEIIHDRFNCLFHPLVGLSPIFSCGLAATQALKIQTNSVKFFENMSQPGGLLLAPGEISDETAKRLKEYWQENFTGNNAGKLAALGDGLKYEALTVNAVDAQLVEQLNMSGLQICATYHIPPYMVGVGPEASTLTNVAALNQQYYCQCLQTLIEAIEACMDEGLGLPYVSGKTLRIELEIDDLLRMDPSIMAEVLSKLVKGSITAPNEARLRLNLKPLTGGDTVYMQQQNFSLEALSKRDAQDDPFAGGKPALPAPIAANDESNAQQAAALADYILKGLAWT